MLSHKTILLGTAALTVGLTGVARAETAAAGANALAEVVVTAERRTTNVQKTALAIATLQGDAVESRGLQDAQSLNRLVPGVQIRSTGSGAASLYIRGVGGNITKAMDDAGNAFSIDGVFLSRPYGPDVSFYDLDRVEVLKGPQGTLYGRNATGGAFNVITKKPMLGDYSGSASAEVGSYNLRRFAGAVNLPLAGDTLAARAAFQSIRRDGYYDDGTDDANADAVRVSVLWKPNDTVKLYLSADWAHQGGKGPGKAIHGPDPGDNGKHSAAGANLPTVLGNSVGNGDLASEWVPGGPWQGLCGAGTRAYYQSRVGNKITYQAATGLTTRDNLNASVYEGAGGYSPTAVLAGTAQTACDAFADNTIWGLNATLDWDLGFATLTGVAGYRDTAASQMYYITSEPQFNKNSSKQKSYEVRLASNGDGPLKWIVGAFYLRDDNTYFAINDSQPNTAIPGIANNGPQMWNAPDNYTQSKAAFTQATFSVTPAFRLTGGIRYTEEDKVQQNAAQTLFTYNVLRPTTPAGFTISGIVPTNGEQHYKSTTYKAGGEYDITDHNMLYLTYSTGFHAGGLNPGFATGPAGTNVYRPEILKAFALGSKNRFFDGRLQVNTEAFHWKYTDLQVGGLQFINLTPTSTTLSFKQLNAGSATIYGIDTDISWLITDHDLLGANILWNKSKYDTFRIPSFAGPAADRVLSGRQISADPEWTIAFNYEHTFPLASGASIVAGAHGKYNDGAYYSYGQEPGTFQKAYLRSDLDLTYNAPNEAWSVKAYVRNLTDEVTMNQSTSDGAITGTPYLSLDPPRTYGVVVSAHF